MTGANIAVIDIGKTNAKLALIDPKTLREIEVLTRPNTVLPGPPYPHFDVDGHWAFLLNGLSKLHSMHGIAAISITTHGASGALLANDGTLAAPVLDYEHDGPDSVAAVYDALRPPFKTTGAPRLPGGLNLGAQFHWQFLDDPNLLDRVETIVTYPQYWSHRLTGNAATDVTSLGCHTDLWEPENGRFSTLADTLGIRAKLAPPRKPGDVLGSILPEIARATGLPEDTPVACGIHDSNASLLPHLVRRDPPFSVVSTGTWIIALAVGGTSPALDPARDTLMNVNALGDPVPSARFMGGREYDLLTAGQASEASDTDITEVFEEGIFHLPCVVPESGPFQGYSAHWIGREPAIGTGTRSAAIAFYLALMTAESLSLIGHRGAIVVEGPFARNRAYLQMLASATESKVHAAGNATGTTEGAALLCKSLAPQDAVPQPKAFEQIPAYTSYAAAWSRHVAALQPTAQA